MAPPDMLEILKGYDAILLGALGDVRSDRDPRWIPDGTSLRPLLDIRQGFDLWCCERPAVFLDGAKQYLADPRARSVDMLVIRENSEGEYSGFGRRLGNDAAVEISVHTRTATARIVRHGFQRAVQRSTGRTPRSEWHDRHAQVCLITKRNAQKFAGQFLTDIFREVAVQFPDVDTHHELMDAAAMKFVTAPWMRKSES